jgi:N-acetylglucosamine-6-phosphate deacetylase
VTNQVLLFDKTIQGLVPVDAVPSGVEIIDANNSYVAPGFINIHIHGCGGADTMDATPAALTTMSKIQAATGVTAFLPTTMTYDFASIDKALNNIRQVRNGQTEPGAKILGAYLEGPFISAAYKGAQKADHIQPADFHKIAPYADIIKYVLVAPEEVPVQALEVFAKAAQKYQFKLTLGHSNASYEQALTFINKYGCQHITHLFNGMAPFHHRHPGCVGAALDSSATCELICDNIHSHPAAQRLACKLKGLDHLILITDSMRACGQGDGVSELGGQKVWVQGQQATLADGTIAGSVLTLDRALANFRENTGLTIPEVVRLVTLNPSVELGDTGRGRLEPGCRADLTLFDENFKIQATYVGGTAVYRKK